MSSKNKGQILAEILVALGIISIIIIAVYQLFAVTSQGKEFASRETQATALLQEQFEALKSIREQGWNNLSLGLFYLTTNGTAWSLQPISTPSQAEQIGDYQRYFEIKKVHRDENGNIAPQGTEDKSTFEVTASISWQKPRERLITATTYLTRYLDNLTWTQTTKADFDAGQKDLVKTIDPPQNNGEVQLVGGCYESTPEALIYDDQLRSGWRFNCDGLSFWRWLLCKLIWFFNNGKITEKSSEHTYNNSPYAMKIELKPPSFGGFWSWARIYNFDAVCTIGFKNLHFYAYNPSTQQIDFYLTAVYEQWENTHVILPPQQWTEVSIDYEDLGEGFEKSLKSIYFSRFFWYTDPPITFYLDSLELTGGVGGYFTQGTLSSSVFDSGASSSLNHLEFSAQTPSNTEIGFQTAVSDNPDGLWEFAGPQGTSLDTDLYKNPAGEGIFFGKNIGRYFRYKAFLKSFDGKNTPVLEDVTVNYSP
jgi:type II secretory pathway pseudopilin PulG